MSELFTRLAGVVLVALAVSSCASRQTVTAPVPAPQFEASATVTTLWQYRLSGNAPARYLNLQPAITKTSVFASSEGGEVVRLQRDSGRVEWKVQLDAEISGGVAADERQVAIGTSNGELIVLESETGEVQWRKQLSGQILSTPALDASRLVVQSLDGRLYGLNREDGATIWLFDTSIPVLTLRGETNPVILGGITLAGFANGKLIALDTAQGFVGWEYAIGEAKGRSELERLIDLDGQFVVSGSTVFASTYQGKLVAIDVSSGRVRWEAPLASFLGLAESLGRLYLVDAESLLVGLDANNGERVWEQDDLKGRRLSSPVAYDRYLVTGDLEGYLYWLDSASGDFVARTQIAQPAYHLAPAKAESLNHAAAGEEAARMQAKVAGGKVYIQTNRGVISALQLD